MRTFVTGNVIQASEHNTNFDLLKEAFVNMEFASIIEEKYWNRFVNTFKLLEK